ncbi:hypothetical protein P168DRAFT_331865 [Aspergillus campestris IBT 28561]|uniref:Uncharacterized protein n=1 Tax=Aspergillus campestris (strain IBT 28561) TaxID=1392248 RepID=A0A2I1DEX9_ASPC2|nr:uncharacterized protein P168DRAFT_331865 [Aspergillus campestris IBT 28561]PKY08426.1 hypothetical protein P168DRAFT_331865 [Aspergillus campestris IBT 28561]
MAQGKFLVKFLSLLAFAIPVNLRNWLFTHTHVLNKLKQTHTDQRNQYQGYESDPTAGDAVCAVNGTGFTLSHRTTIAVPETILCDAPFPEKDTSPQGILHQEIHSKPRAQPRFTPIPLPPPVTLGYVPARETVHAETVVSCSDPWDRMPSGSRVSHGLLPVYRASSVTAPVPAGSTGSIGYDNAQTGSGSSRLGPSASAAEGVQGGMEGLGPGDDLGDSGQARSTGSSLFSGGSLQRETPRGLFALLVVTTVLGFAGGLW